MCFAKPAVLCLLRAAGCAKHRPFRSIHLCPPTPMARAASAVELGYIGGKWVHSGAGAAFDVLSESRALLHAAALRWRVGHQFPH